MEQEKFIISCYESMSAASGEMLEAARKNDWDSLIAAERVCAQIVEKLKALDNVVPNDPQLRQRKAEIIRKVLAEDAEIRSLTEPWMKQLEGFLQSAGKSKKMSQMYGMSSGD